MIRTRFCIRNFYMKCSGCNRNARHQNEYCFFCDPDVPAEEKQKARSKGGRASRKVTPWSGISEVPEIENIYDLKRLYNSCLVWLITGVLNPSQARAVVSIGSGLRDIFELELITSMLAKRDELLAEGGASWQSISD